MAADRIPLALLGVAVLVTFVATPAIFVAWALAASVLAWLATRAATRRAALVALTAFLAILVVSVPASGLSIGLRGRALFGLDAAGDPAVFASLGIVAAPIAACLLLALLPAPSRSRSLARWAIASFGALLLVMLAVLRGERIAGLIGLFGGLTILLLVASMGLALWRAAPVKAS